MTGTGASAFRDLGGDEAGGSQCAVTFHTVKSVLRCSLKHRS